MEHAYEIKQTRDGWHYAQCSCGWRSLAQPPQKQDAAERSGEGHLSVAKTASA